MQRAEGKHERTQRRRREPRAARPRRFAAEGREKRGWRAGIRADPGDDDPFGSFSTMVPLLLVLPAR